MACPTSYAEIACLSEHVYTKQGELVWREHIALWLGLDAIPEFGNGSLQDGGRLGRKKLPSPTTTKTSTPQLNT
jgi:hypothetical protein